MSIEIFKTNVTDTHQANWLIAEIHKTFSGYHANFDLNDCDRVLRIVCNSGSIQLAYFIEWLKDNGTFAEVLPDN